MEYSREGVPPRLAGSFGSGKIKDLLFRGLFLDVVDAMGIVGDGGAKSRQRQNSMAIANAHLQRSIVIFLVKKVTTSHVKLHRDTIRLTIREQIGTFPSLVPLRPDARQVCNGNLPATNREALFPDSLVAVVKTGARIICLTLFRPALPCRFFGAVKGTTP